MPTPLYSVRKRLPARLAQPHDLRKIGVGGFVETLLRQPCGNSFIDLSRCGKYAVTNRTFPFFCFFFGLEFRFQRLRFGSLFLLLFGPHNYADHQHQNA